VDGMIRDGLWDSFSNTHMGNLAEYTAKKAASPVPNKIICIGEPSQSGARDGVLLLQG